MLHAPVASDGFHEFAFRQSKSVLTQSAQSPIGDTSRMFQSPHPAGRRITMGFSWMQRLGKGATIDLWFPNVLKNKLNSLVEGGLTLGDEHFPAEWAAVRQFELL